jgi:hypothetical protein
MAERLLTDREDWSIRAALKEAPCAAQFQGLWPPTLVDCILAQNCSRLAP